jgi:hypothetical protein
MRLAKAASAISVTRREALAGIAAGAVALAAPKLAGTSMASPVIKAGATLPLGAFPRGTTVAAAMSEWSKVTGCRPLSTKVWFGRRKFPVRLGWQDALVRRDGRDGHTLL